MAQALDEINTARGAAGIHNVSLLAPASSQHRAEDMLANEYFGHYDLNGFFPGYWYTASGGAFVAEENIGYRFDQAGFQDAAATAREIIHIMIYDDASASWGHRDSLMDPSNSYAEVSVAVDGKRFFLVVNMIRQLLDWVAPPTFSNGMFACSGRLSLSGSSIQDVRIYFSNYSLHKGFFYNTPNLNITMGQLSYTLGDPIAGVVPNPYQYFDVATVRPKAWHVSGQDFAFSAPINNTFGPGIYTIAILANNTSPVKSPYNPEYDEYVPILWFAVELP
jgi:hypothetical protein